MRVSPVKLLSFSLLLKTKILHVALYYQLDDCSNLRYYKHTLNERLEMEERKRRLNAGVMSIMQPKDIELMENYKLARKEYELARTKYYAARTPYNRRLDELNAILDPDLEKIYAYIEGLTNEYLLNTPKVRVWGDMRKATNTSVGVSKFGRMMKEYGCYITTKPRTGPYGGKLTPTRHWRKP